MVVYCLKTRLRDVCVVMPNERQGDICRIPDAIYKACWIERLCDMHATVYRNGECVFHWPARKMKNQPYGAT